MWRKSFHSVFISTIWVWLPLYPGRRVSGGALLVRREDDAYAQEIQQARTLMGAFENN